MVIGSHQRLHTLPSAPHLEIRGKPIIGKSLKQNPSVCILTKIFLRMCTYIDELSKKIASCIGALKHVRHFVHSTTLQYIFNSLIQPYFIYCCVVRDNYNTTHASKLQKLQNRSRAAKVLTYSSYDADTDTSDREASLEKIRFPAKKFTRLSWSINRLLGSRLIICAPYITNCGSVSPYSLRGTEGKLVIPMFLTN